MLSAVPDHTVDPLWWARSDSSVVMTLDRVGCAALRRLPEGPRRDRLTRGWRTLVHRGNRVECPVCGARFRHFAPRWNTLNAICWKCDSQERHRALWLFLTRSRPELLDGAGSLLHFAPEPAIAAYLRERLGSAYVTGDIQPGLADVTLDITKLQFGEEEFDGILCAHVLEHVPDDETAMRELHRVLRPNGWCIVMVPLDPSLERTDEDPSIGDPDERRRRFWQEDHVRLYTRDIAERLRAAGFHVEHVPPTDVVDDAEDERYRAVSLGSDIFLCRRSAGHAL
jgi:SAM-dependent methyltransferase